MDQTPKPPANAEDMYFIGEPGLVAMYMCAPAGANRADIEAKANAENPTGIGSGWVISPETEIAGGSHPRQCPDSAGRLHYMLNC
jgi:hypothetical protein